MKLPRQILKTPTLPLILLGVGLATPLIFILICNIIGFDFLDAKESFWTNLGFWTFMTDFFLLVPTCFIWLVIFGILQISPKQREKTHSHIVDRLLVLILGPIILYYMTIYLQLHHTDLTQEVIDCFIVATIIALSFIWLRRRQHHGR
ncbi:MAG TPA: hypothetical protein VG604_02340 [Candidatus Saccharimonadales bacterium]|nr:hypothetical protein [Candidatus Saccharimonadales bacterium]